MSERQRRLMPQPATLEDETSVGLGPGRRLPMSRDDCDGVAGTEAEAVEAAAAWARARMPEDVET